MNETCPPAWSPALGGSLREKAIEKIEEIADYLCRHSDATTGYGLFTGKTGVALFFYYYHRLTGDRSYLDRIRDLLNEAINDMNAQGMPYFSHCDGISGAAWCIDFLYEENILDFGSDVIFGPDFLNIVGSQAKGYLRQNNFDYLHGAIGLLLYLIDRGIDVGNSIEMLLTMADEQPESIKWRSPNHKQKSEDCFNLSLAHGNSSILHLLCASLATGENDRIKDKIEKLVNFILNCKRLPGLTFSFFPNLIPIPERFEYEDSRLAWCYGDLGISYLLYRAGCKLDNKSLQLEALQILEETTKRRSDKETFIADANFCHGTIGIAHIYNRLFCLSGMDSFKDAAEFWYDRTIAYGNVEDGAAGYETWRVGGSEKVTTLLEGISGVGLGLISAVSDISPAWDKFVLLD
jgi:lantibiotic modifying enzyme